MPMDREDLKYFDEKFGQVHKRITESEKAQTGELHKVTDDQNRKITEIREAISAHKLESATHHNAAGAVATEAARKALEGHREDSWLHNPVKTWTLIGAIGGVFAMIGAGIMWVIKHFKL